MGNKKYKVLVVEDEPIILQDIVNEIEAVDMEICVKWTARNGKKALDIIENESPDIIFTDIKMPVMSGLEMIQRIREKNIDVPIVLLTGYAEFEYARQAVKYDVEEYLLKPLETEQLREVLGKILKKLEKQKRDMPFQYEKMELYLLRIGNFRDCDYSGETAEKIASFWKNAELEKWIGELWKNQMFWVIDGKKINQKFLLIEHLEMSDMDISFWQIERLIEKLKEALKEIPVQIALCNHAISYEEIWDYSAELRMMMEGEKCADEILMIGMENKKINRQQLIEEVERYIRKHYMENITVTKLTGKYHFSGNYLTRIFKKHTGKTVVDYLIQVRIEKAMELLETRRELSIQDISKMVGYSDSHYFSRIFKEKQQITPMEYRKKLDEE